jgi:hypothetical protein
MPRLEVAIASNGPIIDRRLWVGPEDATRVSGAGLAVARPFSMFGLLDTGAELTAIQTSLADWMGTCRFTYNGRKSRLMISY